MAPLKWPSNTPYENIAQSQNQGMILLHVPLALDIRLDWRTPFSVGVVHIGGAGTIFATAS